MFITFNICPSRWILDPDFQETTRTLLADISSVRGRLMPVLPSTELSTVNPQLSMPTTSDSGAH